MADSKKSAKTPAPEIEAELPLPGHTAKQVKGLSHWQRFRTWYMAHKIWSIPLSVLAAFLLLLAIPQTRYPLAGLVLKKNFTLQVIDKTTSTPISGADVSSGSISVLTDGNGKAMLRLRVGHQSVSIAKKYYKDSGAKVLVPILGQKTTSVITAQATGRQVKVMVKNAISGKLLADVDIKVLDITAKTDKDGKAMIVLPAGVAAQKATLSLNGYNKADVSVKVSDAKVEENNFTITPAGKVYFLSKLSGKIDVVKSNLDGTSRETVLAGTGREDDRGTVLLASRDWKYLALLSRRDSNLAKLYLIETSSDTVKAIDEGNSNFSLIGWSDDNFVYQVNRIGYQPWQPKAQAIKSFNAQTKQLLPLDDTNATGSSNFDANYETYILDPILLDNFIVYVKTWYSYPGYLSVSGQTDTLNVIRPDGSGKKLIKSLDASKAYFSSTVFHTPSSVYVQINNLDSTPSTYYELSTNGVLTQKGNLSNDDIFKTYPSYLLSPSDKETFWSESRDGKNSLFIGDGVGAAAKQIATLSDYKTYGWYSDDYLLASKNGSELYIFGRDGIKKDSDAMKVTDYHKPILSYPGYGGGYGGL